MLVVLLAGVTLIGGCGKKGPPAAPQRYRPAAVTDLSYELTDGRVEIFWTIPRPGDGKRARISGCTVYRAQRALSGTGCIDCRFSFQKAAEVAVPTDASGEARQRRLRFDDVLTPGFETAYRVTCSTAAGVSGDPSNMVRIEVLQPTTEKP